MGVEKLKEQEKTNETTAIPDLLGLVDVDGDIVAIDALVCQKAIGKKTGEQKRRLGTSTKGEPEDALRGCKAVF